MQEFSDWFNKFTAATHISFASALVAAGALYTAYLNVPQVAIVLNETYASLPPAVRAVVVAAVAWYVWYRNGEKPAPSK